MKNAPAKIPHAKVDKRISAQRALAIHHREITDWLDASELEYDDQCTQFLKRESTLKLEHEPRDYQSQAVSDWLDQNARGMCIMPTGSGKTLTALLAMQKKAVSTLVVTPTLDLVAQWHGILEKACGESVGIMGGGTHDVQPITVTTYDSAHLFMEHIGNRFEMLIFDEAHHLPSPTYQKAALMSLAPFRLGLTATPERLDGGDQLLDTLVGHVAFRQDIDQMAGNVLADYDTETIEVELSEDERKEYDEARAVYLAFLRKMRIRMSGPRGFQTFLSRASQSDEGREALDAYRKQKDLSRGASAKHKWVHELLKKHKDEQTIIFTDDNKSAYAISRQLLIPVITHQTKVKERKIILEGLREKRFHAVCTSRVLNEGVDVPSASVAIVVSGSGSVREHVQRLGRILRKDGETRAKLYELVSKGTSETSTSKRRREHRAYR